MLEQPRPFVKWAGGKSTLVPQILERIPASWNRETDLYIEPFLGGGAVFFALQPKRAILNDRNFQLMCLYHNVQRNLDQLFEVFERTRRLYVHAPEKTYADIRGAYNEELRTYKGQSDVYQAARLFFLNKTCFNGLYRTNADGEFNVPWNHNPNVGFPTLEHLQCCSAALQGATLLSHDFADPQIAKLDVKGALIYCDPPYAPVSATSDFTKYTAEGFEYVCQLHLAIQAVYWRQEGAHVILSQSANESLVEQYRRLGFRTDLVQAKRNINSKGDRRGPVGEYIIY